MQSHVNNPQDPAPDPFGSGSLTALSLPPLNASEVPANHLEKFVGVRNSYFIMRHGHSVSNAIGIFMSDRRCAGQAFGLTELGEEQALNSALDFYQRQGSRFRPEDILVVSSPFRRTRETAQILAGVLCPAAAVAFSSLLEERSFGAWDGLSSDAWQRIAAGDRLDSFHSTDGLESPNAVLERTTRLVRTLEADCRQKAIVLVSHSTTLNILRCGFAKIPSNHYLKFEDIRNGQLMELKLNRGCA